MKKRNWFYFLFYDSVNRYWVLTIVGKKLSRREFNHVFEQTFTSDLIFIRTEGIIKQTDKFEQIVMNIKGKISYVSKSKRFSLQGANK